MITKEMFVDILSMYKQGDSIRKIAIALGISRNTVRKYLRESDKYSVYRKGKTKGSYLDPYKEYLQARIESAKPKWIPATVLLKEIAAKGYKGKISILRNYIRSFKKVNPEEPVVRFETEPGKQMQIDFVTVSARKGERFKAFVATLGYSRASFVKFYPNEKTESWIDGVIEACQYFRGVPKEILCDNAKSLIIERDAYGEGKHRYNSYLLDLSKYLGFKIKACRPYRPETKVKVERFYKDDFFVYYLYPAKCKQDEVQSYKINGYKNIFSFPFKSAEHGVACFGFNYPYLFSFIR